MLPFTQRESWKKSHPPSEPGRGGDPRAAGAPQQARISPAKREDARRLAPCGERRTGYTSCDSDALRHTDRGSTGVVGGVEGLAPLTPCPISAVDARKASASPNGHGPAGRHSVARREATTPGRRAEAASRRQKKCSGANDAGLTLHPFEKRKSPCLIVTDRANVNGKET